MPEIASETPTPTLSAPIISGPAPVAAGPSATGAPPHAASVQTLIPRRTTLLHVSRRGSERMEQGPNLWRREGGVWHRIRERCQIRLCR